MKEFAMNGTPVKMWANMCDATAWQQISNLCSLPFVFRHLALMPDLHGGKGMPIGTVLATKDVVIPNAVGVDIGCGMCAVKTNIKVETIEQEVLRKKIMRGIRKQIPLGMEHHKEAQEEKYMPANHDVDSMTIVKRQYVSATKQVGTLGGGNHFIELQSDDEGWLWIMIHSGSRNLGKQVCDYYSRVAMILNERYFSSVKPELNLPFLPLKTKEFNEYWSEMQYCIDFGLCNRNLIMQRIEEVISSRPPACCPCARNAARAINGAAFSPPPFWDCCLGRTRNPRCSSAFWAITRSCSRVSTRSAAARCAFSRSSGCTSSQSARCTRCSSLCSGSTR